MTNSRKSSTEEVKRSASKPGSAHPLDLADGRRIRSTTVICVRRGDSVVMAADGQVSLGSTVMKHSAKKIRKLYQDKVLAGFAGSTADAFSLFARFETKLNSMRETLDGQRWNWRRTGAQTRCCDSLRPC